MATNGYPIRMRISRGTRDGLHTDEVGAWEDAGCPETFEQWKERVTGNTSALTVIVLDRYKTVVEMRNEAEARAVIYSAEYWGDPSGMQEPLYSYRAALRRLGARIREALATVK